MRRFARQVRNLALVLAGLGALGMGSAAAPEAGTLLGVSCAAPPVWHCPDSECLGSVVTQEGTVVEMKSRRPYFLDCPLELQARRQGQCSLEP